MLGTKMETLLAVVEYKNFTKAAEALSLTQPAVSHHINQLEEELGAVLFVGGIPMIVLGAVNAVWPVMILGIVFTGGGFYENVPRMMTDGLTARIQLSSFPKLPIFQLIQDKGNIPERDMYNTFNMGIGMILALPAAQAGLALSVLKEAGETAYQIGEVVAGEAGVELV